MHWDDRDITKASVIEVKVQPKISYYTHSTEINIYDETYNQDQIILQLSTKYNSI